MMTIFSSTVTAAGIGRFHLDLTSCGGPVLDASVPTLIFRTWTIPLPNKSTGESMTRVRQTKEFPSEGRIEDVRASYIAQNLAIGLGPEPNITTYYYDRANSGFADLIIETGSVSEENSHGVRIDTDKDAAAVFRATYRIEDDGRCRLDLSPFNSKPYPAEIK
jgi:hypothetical protein